jgi:hypothetical protein
MPCEIRFIGQSKATTVQVHVSEPFDSEENDKVMAEAKRLYAQGLSHASNFTKAQLR